MSKVVTAQEVESWPENENGIKVFPAFTIFSERCVFSEDCSFGEECVFGEDCSFGEQCSFSKWCSFDEGCSFGERCSFGKGCSFDKRGSFGKRCSFGEGCSFGERGAFGKRCSFGKGCSFDKRGAFGGWCSFGEGCIFGEGCVAVSPLWSFVYEPPFKTKGAIYPTSSCRKYWEERLGIDLGNDFCDQIKEKYGKNIPDFLKRTDLTRCERRILNSWLEKEVKPEDDK